MQTQASVFSATLNCPTKRQLCTSINECGQYSTRCVHLHHCWHERTHRNGRGQHANWRLRFSCLWEVDIGQPLCFLLLFRNISSWNVWSIVNCTRARCAKWVILSYVYLSQQAHWNIRSLDGAAWPDRVISFINCTHSSMNNTCA